MLSKRLSAIASFIPSGGVLVDVGTDHGYLPIELIKQGRIDSAIAADIANKPLESAILNIKNEGLQDKIKCILSDGLKDINDYFDTIVIAGLGGNTIVSILDESIVKTMNASDIIIEANNDSMIVRQFLTSIGYMIEEETLIEENDIIYEIIHFCKGVSNYSEIEFRFGPCLLKSNNPLLIKKLENELEHDTMILNKIPDYEEEKKEYFEYRNTQINKVLSILKKK